MFIAMLNCQMVKCQAGKWWWITHVKGCILQTGSLWTSDHFIHSNGISNQRIPPNQLFFCMMINHDKPLHFGVPHFWTLAIYGRYMQTAWRESPKATFGATGRTAFHRGDFTEGTNAAWIFSMPPSQISKLAGSYYIYIRYNIIYI